MRPSDWLSEMIGVRDLTRTGFHRANVMEIFRNLRNLQSAALGHSRRRPGAESRPQGKTLARGGRSGSLPKPSQNGSFSLLSGSGRLGGPLGRPRDWGTGPGSRGRATGVRHLARPRDWGTWLPGLAPRSSGAVPRSFGAKPRVHVLCFAFAVAFKGLR